ncbi:MAG: type II secretion system protein GspJ [Polyangiales bacterium]
MSAGSPSRAAQRGLTLIEMMIAVSVLSLISILIYGAFSAMSTGKTRAAILSERFRLGRLAMTRMSRELGMSYLSGHAAATPALTARVTAFLGTSRRVDFNAFAHRRLIKDAHESDQCEISYFTGTDSVVSTQTNLLRREQTIIDDVPGKGGVVNVLVDDVETFSLKFFDPLTGLWTDTWDSTSTSANFARMPFQVQLTLVMKGGPAGEPIRLVTKADINMLQPLGFAIK